MKNPMFHTKLWITLGIVVALLALIAVEAYVNTAFGAPVI